jgi:hypothetical protein
MADDLHGGADEGCEENPEKDMVLEDIFEAGKSVENEKRLLMLKVKYSTGSVTKRWDPHE